MKSVGVRQARDSLTSFLELSQKETILILKRGRPYALVTGVQGREVIDIIKEDSEKKRPSSRRGRG